MLLSAVSVFFVAQSSSEIPGGLMNNPVYMLVLQVFLISIYNLHMILTYHYCKRYGIPYSAHYVCTWTLFYFGLMMAVYSRNMSP